MSAYFLDSSALVKRYVTEIGSKWMISFCKPSARNSIFVVRIAGVEVVSAIARRRKGLSITPINSQKSIIRFQRDYHKRFTKISLTPKLTETAMQLADKYELRGYDAVQLASAIEANNLRQLNGLSSIVFISADNALNLAAQSEGLTNDNPNNYP